MSMSTITSTWERFDDDDQRDTRTLQGYREGYGRHGADEPPVISAEPPPSTSSGRTFSDDRGAAIPVRVKRPEAARASSAPLPPPARRNPPHTHSHLRSRSSGAALLSAPAMTRSHSSPVSASRGTSASNTPSSGSLSPGSPLRSPARQRSPFRTQEESSYNPPPRSPSGFDILGGGLAIQSIQEDSELDITPRQQHPMYAPFARSSSLRRRPASPLHHVTNAMPSPSAPLANTENTNTPVSAHGSHSPSLGPLRYNEAYPPLHHYASSSSFSSIPSTPTSARSRSPSISSLETIEDAPDLESEAIEAERIERLRLAAERAENGDDSDDNPRRRSSLDVPRGFGFSRGGNRERKRWSVCGGERRADLDLETIWED